MSGSALEWYLQRVTGGLLLILLVLHFWVEHYMTAELLRGEITYGGVVSRVSHPLWQWIDLSFLALALYHGLAGLRGILLDYGRLGGGARRLVTLLLTLAGLLWFYWGWEAFRNL